MPDSSGTTPKGGWILDGPVASLISSKARRLSRSPGFSRSDAPDIEQELRLHLLRKAPRYDVTRSKAITFAKRVIANRLASIARKVRAKKRFDGAVEPSLNDPVSHEGRIVERGDTIDLADARRHTGQRVRSEADDAQRRLDMAEANSELSPQTKRLVALVSHVPQFAAGQVLGMSRRETARCMAEVKRVYETRGLDF